MKYITAAKAKNRSKDDDVLGFIDIIVCECGEEFQEIHGTKTLEKFAKHVLKEHMRN